MRIFGRIGEFADQGYQLPCAPGEFRPVQSSDIILKEIAY